MTKARQGARRAARAGAGLLLSAVLFNGVSAGAQQYNIGSNNPNVFVNTDLLNSLGPGGSGGYFPYQGAVGYAGGYPGGQFGAPQPGSLFLTRPGTLLFPPGAYPRSQLVNRGANVALTAPQGQASAASGAAPQLDLPTLSAPSAPAVADVPKSAEPQGQAGPAVAPPPPVSAPSDTELAEAPTAEPSDNQGTLNAVPAPPEPPASETMAKEPEAETQLAPPPPPEVAAASDTVAETASESAAGEAPAAAVPAPPSSDAAEEAPAAQAEAPTQEAAVPPANLAESEMRLLFTQGKAELSDEVKAELRKLAKDLIADGNARVQLLAYATSSDDSASRARRLSLSRALAVRAYLIDQGVRSTRMDVRALGDKAEQEPKDRVDIQPARS